MVEPVVAVALETIRDLLVQEGKLLFGVRDQVEELRGELEDLESFLKDANRRKHEDERLRTCVNQAKGFAYKAQDIVEEYVIKVASKRGEGLRKVARRVAGIVGEGIIHEVGNEIGKIKTEIADLIKRLEGYGINQIIEAPPSPATIENQRQLRTTYAHEKDEYFMGMEDDVSKIVTWVTEDNKIRRIISICGVGGLGKTTIARKVYNHRQVKESFECFAWVSVTRQCQVKMLLHDILIQMVGDKVEEEEASVQKLYDVLKNKKCFVVLDDIREINDWERLSKAFPSFVGISKILLTTRTSEVAKVAHLQHEPSLLDEKDGWDLLTKIASNLKKDRVDKLLENVEGIARDMLLDKLLENVEGIARDMLRKCGGLPLAIATIGGILRNKDPLTEWEDVNKKFEIYMRGDDGILSVLAFSYDDLSSNLRDCFLYMGCFREDEEIDFMHLYQLWMAEGLIPSSMQEPGESLMDVASKVLDELISRHMVQPQTKNILTAKKSCRLHDLVRELCLTKGKEENFMEFESKKFENDDAWVIRYDGFDLCRKSILIDIVSEDYERRVSVEISGHDTYIRTLMLNCSGSSIFGSRPVFKFSNRPLFKFNGTRFNFKRLRSLVLDGCKFKNKKLPKEIRDMIHLRYLSLADTLNKGKLPAFIGDLLYLQTLNLAYNWGLQLPNIFHKMKRLRCLYLPADRRQSMFTKSLEFHGLNELEIVEGFDSRYDKFTLSELLNLRRFSARIWGYENLSAILVQLSSLLKLQYTSIIFLIEDDSESQLEQSSHAINKLLLCRHLHNLGLVGPIGNFPRYEPQLWPDLVYLELYKTKFEDDQMSFLQKLPNLRELKIWQAYVGKEMYCSSKAFPKLTLLSLGWLENIEIWRVEAGAFPNLSTLTIRDCNSFEIVPHGLTNITSLTRIEIYDMPEEFRIKYGKQNTNH